MTVMGEVLPVAIREGLMARIRELEEVERLKGKNIRELEAEVESLKYVNSSIQPLFLSACDQRDRLLEAWEKSKRRGGVRGMTRFESVAAAIRKEIEATSTPTSPPSDPGC